MWLAIIIIAKLLNYDVHAFYISQCLCACIMGAGPGIEKHSIVDLLIHVIGRINMAFRIKPDWLLAVSLYLLKYYRYYYVLG